MYGPITTKYSESIDYGHIELTDWATLLHPCRGRRGFSAANSDPRECAHHKFDTGAAPHYRLPCDTVADNGERHVYNEVECCPYT